MFLKFGQIVCNFRRLQYRTLEEVFTVILEPFGSLLSRAGKSDQPLGLLGYHSPMNQGSVAESYEAGMLNEHTLVSLLRVW